MSANLYIQQKDFSKARDALNHASKIFPGEDSFEALFLTKWESLILAEESRSIDTLLKFRQKALQKKQWEGVREADLFSLKIHFDQDRLDYLAFGTSLVSYRQRISAEIGRQPASQFILGQGNGKILDISTGEFKGPAALNPGKKIHQVISSLVKDFYAPRTLGVLFAEIYPDEYFNVDSSPLKMRKILSRTRQWFEVNHIPAHLQQTSGGYTLNIRGNFGILIPLQSHAIDTVSLQIAQLRALLENAKGPLSAKQISANLNWSRAQFLLIVDRAILAGFVTRTGVGKSTRYSSHTGADLSALRVAA